jgi:hypothetical protein
MIVMVSREKFFRCGTSNSIAFPENSIYDHFT